NGQLYVYKITSELNNIESYDFSNIVQVIPENVQRIIGDIDGNQVCNIADLILVLQIISDIKPHGYDVLYRNSIDSTNKVKLNDAIYLIKYLAQNNY
ncbi:hypothetical protein MHK_010049, partial [Candidatus Magnetomorum sp. HK-1]